MVPGFFFLFNPTLLSICVEGLDPKIKAKRSLPEVQNRKQGSAQMMKPYLGFCIKELGT